ncbi:transposon Tf2-12 polyprotein [Nephila pilipes]|uniref:RNA-directed DNA polymerase n=1 Tax=Nephila pilipes TaxID=299642 RepID=A0A8X6UEX9_NEPPI|nr:transposon Tf2-12 polyprotein [Nephila pilipes]
MDENKSDPTALNFDNPNTEINRVAVKPPIFWRNKPKLWFLQLEAQFANSGISQDATKYNIVVAALDENVLDFVVDILSNPPENEKYNTLKKALLNRLTDTEESRLKKLLTDLELGDKRPSDLLRQMKSLAGNSISDEIIKSLWLQRLPQQTQAILTISNDTLDKIAEMADKIIAVYSSSEICQVTKVGSLPNSALSFDRNKLDVLQADIAALTKTFDEFSRNTRSRSKSRGNDRRRRSRSNSARYEFCCYLDDILIASKDDAQHISHLRQVFQRLQDAELVIKVAKCKFSQTEVNFLGHRISFNGIEPTKERIKVIEDFKLPETIKEFRRFLGIINFYHRFIPNAAENQAILNEYLRGKKKNDNNKIPWTEEAIQAFQNCKQQLCHATVLVYPSEDAHISLMVDASDLYIYKRNTTD